MTRLERIARLVSHQRGQDPDERVQLPMPDGKAAIRWGRRWQLIAMTEVRAWQEIQQAIAIVDDEDVPQYPDPGTPGL